MSVVKHTRGFTLTEIIISTALLAAIAASLMAVFVAGKRHIMHARLRMQAAEIDKMFIEPLSNDVRQDTWDNQTNNLSVTTNKQLGSVNISNVTFDAAYNVSDMNTSTYPGSPQLRKVVIGVNWTEPTQ